MKPYRVKRGDKFIGSFIVVHDGKRVNLATKDASEARRRALLVKKGQWPPAGDAAAAVKNALEGREPETDEISESESEAVDGVQAVPVQTVGSGPVVPASDPGAGGVGSVGAPEDAAPIAAADAVNAAAGSDAELDALAGEAKAALADAGLDIAELREKAPQLISGAHLWLQGQLARGGVRVFKGKWPKLVTLPPEDDLRGLLGRIDVALLARMNIDVDKISPVWWLIGLSLVTMTAQVGGMLEQIEQDEKAAEAKAVN